MSRPERFRVEVGEQSVEVELLPAENGTNDGSMTAVVGETTFSVHAAPDGSWSVRPQGGTAQERVWLDRGPGRPTYAATGGDTAPVAVQTAAEAALIAALEEASGGAGGGGAVKAPMPGRIVKALVAEGDDVVVGQPVIIVEAMKMENEVLSEGAGSIRRILVSAGDTVDAGAVLVEIEPHDA